MRDDSHIPFRALGKFAKRLGYSPSGWGKMPLNQMESIRVLACVDLWTSSRRYGISEHIVADTLRRSAPSIIWTLVCQNVIRNIMNIPGKPGGSCEINHPFSTNPIGKAPGGNPRYRAVSRRRVTEWVNEDIDAEACESPLARHPYRSQPEAHTSATKQTFSGYLIALRPYQADPNDRARDGRIGRLRESIAAYGQAEKVHERHPRFGEAGCA